MSETWTSSALDGQSPSFVARPEPAATILVAHDDHRVQALLHDLLQDPRGRVIEVADVGTATVLAQTLRPDCFVFDPALPGLHWDALLEQLRRDPRTRQTPVIMLTAGEGSADRVERVLAEGAVDYIGRPASSAHVAARVRGAIRRAHRLPDLGNIRTDFIAMLVHDLRTPLTVIQGYLDLLETTPSTHPESPSRYLRNMLACCAQMTGLVDEILDLYKQDAGKFMGEARPVDLAALVANVAGRFARAAVRRGIALEISGAERPLQVLGDAGRLDQVLMNLLGNALKFTPDGGTVTAAIRPLNGEIEVSVADSGPGIPAAEIPFLFERFGQAEEGRRSGAAGTGLGLLICRRVLEAHGGHIWVESEPGSGARFVFRLVRLLDS
ncbi:MAG: ATP-binding response regulator [Candidatus Rokuibacteriota bacterium]